ncbi:MAG: nitroreductase family protein [Candidatus Heimdallarchaeota archaeon]|nr:nitroreductase family protein [Candidatus Heimdallarchaeota archaeon]
MDNPVINQIFTHKSIRKFNPKYEIPRDHIDIMIKAGQQASSSCSGQTYSIIEIPKEKRISNSICGKQQFILDASYFAVICVDLFRLHRIVEQSGGTNPTWPLTGFMIGIFDAGLMAQNMALAAESLGYGICFAGTCGDRSEEIIKELDLPQYVLPITGIAIGQSLENPPIRPRLPTTMIHHQNKYHQYSADEIEEGITQMSDKLEAEGYYRNVSNKNNYTWRDHMKNKFGGDWLNKVEIARKKSMQNQKFLSQEE